MLMLPPPGGEENFFKCRFLAKLLSQKKLSQRHENIQKFETKSGQNIYFFIANEICVFHQNEKVVALDAWELVQI